MGIALDWNLYTLHLCLARSDYIVHREDWLLTSLGQADGMSLQYVEDFERPAEDDAKDPTNDYFVVQWHPHGAVIAGSLKGKLEAWEATTGTAVCFSSEKVHAIGINCISIAADGASMLTSSIDGAVALWDTSALKPAMAKMRSDRAQRGALSSTEQEEESRHAEGRNANEPLIMLEQAKVLHTESGLKKRSNEDGLNAQRGDTLPREVVSFSPFITALHPTLPLFASTGAGGLVVLHHLGRASENEEGAFGKRKLEMRNEVELDAQPPLAQKQSTNDRIKRRSDYGTAMAFDPQGNLLAVGTQQGCVNVYEVTTGSCIAQMRDHTLMIRTVTLLGDGRLLTGCDDGLVTLYDIFCETHADRLLSSQGGSSSQGTTEEALRYLEFLSASQYSSISNGSTLRRQVQYVRSWSAHEGFVTSVRVSRDGRLAATCALGGQIKIWDLAAGASAASPVWTMTQESEAWALDWQSNANAQDDDDNDGEVGNAQTLGTQSSTASMMTAAASSARAAARFVVAGGDGSVRWYRAAGSAVA